MMNAKNAHYINIIKDAGNDTNKLLQILNSLIGRMKPKILPDNPNSTNTINFDDFFNIKTIINSLPKTTQPQL